MHTTSKNTCQLLPHHRREQSPGAYVFAREGLATTPRPSPATRRSAISFWQFQKVARRHGAFRQSTRCCREPRASMVFANTKRVALDARRSVLGPVSPTGGADSFCRLVWKYKRSNGAPAGWAGGRLAGNRRRPVLAAPAPADLPALAPADPSQLVQMAASVTRVNSLNEEHKMVQSPQLQHPEIRPACAPLQVSVRLRFHYMFMACDYRRESGPV